LTKYNNMQLNCLEGMKVQSSSPKESGKFNMFMHEYLHDHNQSASL
jgi:hypothetical protein